MMTRTDSVSLHATFDDIAKKASSACRAVRNNRASLPYRPTLTFATRYGLTLLPLFLSLVLLTRTNALWAWVATALIAGFTQNGLVILTHEGSHYFFHASRRVNDLLVNLLVTMPIGSAVDAYRGPHLEHHRNCCDETDPYFGVYGPYHTRRDLISGFAQDLFLITALRTAVRTNVASTSANSPTAGGLARMAAVGVLMVQGVIALAFWRLTGIWFAYLLLWVLPMATIPMVVNRIRTFVEHHAEADGAEAGRSTLPTRAEYFLIAPYGYAFHFEHHVMPEIPYSQLGWAHQEMKEQGWEYDTQSLAPRGYLASFFELAQRLP